MSTITRAIILPLLFILPLAFIKINHPDLTISEIIDGQPALLIFLLPGLVMAVRGIVKKIWGR